MEPVVVQFSRERERARERERDQIRREIELSQNGASCSSVQ
jgi:hypothetical protein